MKTYQSLQWWFIWLVGFVFVCVLVCYYFVGGGCLAGLGFFGGGFCLFWFWVLLLFFLFVCLVFVTLQSSEDFTTV